MLSHGLHEYRGQDPEHFRLVLEGCGYHVYTLASTIRDKTSFVDAVRAVLPLDPPVVTGNWDALEDSLWEGLYELPAPKIAIIWPGSAHMGAEAPKEYQIAKGVFSQVAESLWDPKQTVGKVKEVVVLLV